MLWNVRLYAGGGGLVSDRDLSVPTFTHPFVWVVQHSPESNAGQAGIFVQIFKVSPVSLTQKGACCFTLFASTMFLNQTGYNSKLISTFNIITYKNTTF